MAKLLNIQRIFNSFVDGQPATNKTVIMLDNSRTDHLTDLHDEVVDGVALTTRYNSKEQNRVKGFHRQEEELEVRTRTRISS